MKTLSVQIKEDSTQYHEEDRIVGNAYRRLTGYEGCQANDQSFHAMDAIIKDCIREATHLGLNVGYVTQMLNRLHIGL